MSHASLLVAIAQTKDVEAAVSEQMMPFDENGEIFADGSRWDWYRIGGRWDGYMANGNTIQIKDIHPNKFKAKRDKDAAEHWKEFLKESANVRGFCMVATRLYLSAISFRNEHKDGFPRITRSCPTGIGTSAAEWAGLA